MIDFTIDGKILKNAMSVASIATEAKEDSITGHCLFDFSEEGLLKIYATDKKNHMSCFKFKVSEKLEGMFTTDPRKILNLMKTTETDSLSLNFDSDTATLQISESDESYISLPSFKPEDYSSLSDSFDKAFEVKTINAGIFMTGIKFIKGFLDTKDKKFSNLYISSGVMYGSNGSNKAAAYTSPEFDELNDLIFPISSISAISEMIDKMDPKNIVISTSSNHIFLSSPDKNYIFGFTKVQQKMPRIPISIKDPETPGYKISKKVLLKKLSKFHAAGDSSIGIKGKFADNKLSLSTISDRVSKDVISCESLESEATELDFITECRLLESALNQFDGDMVNVYVDKKIIMHNKASIEITEKDETIMVSFTSAAVVSLSRES